MSEEILMPLMADYISKTAPMKNVVLLNINRNMMNSYRFNSYMEKVYGKTIFVATPYGHTKNKEVAEYAKIHYFAKKNDKDDYDLCKGEEKAFGSAKSPRDATTKMLREALLKDVLPELEKGKEYLIIEDGCYHHEMIEELSAKYPLFKEKLLGVVEQTTSGTRKAGKLKNVDYPFISVARSDLKMHIESIFIGRRIVEELSMMLYSINRFFAFGHVLIGGYGILGRSVANALHGMYCDVRTYDCDERIRAVSRRDGLTTYMDPSPKMFSGTTVFIGCVGKPMFNRELLTAFMESEGDTLVLASASVGTVEMKYFIDLTEGTITDSEFTITPGVKTATMKGYEIIYRGRKKTIYLAAKGKPVNFFRTDAISLTDRSIDLIFYEMALAAATIYLHHEKLPHKLMLLGGDDCSEYFPKEKEILLHWFVLNHMNIPDHIDEALRFHPESDYLRDNLLDWND